MEGRSACPPTSFKKFKECWRATSKATAAAPPAQKRRSQTAMLTNSIRRDLRSLSSQGFEVKDLGQRTLKGLENPEHIWLMYPHSLASRLVVQQQKQEQEARAQQASEAESKKRCATPRLTIDTDNVWDLWHVSLRLGDAV